MAAGIRDKNDLKSSRKVALLDVDGGRLVAAAATPDPATIGAVDSIRRGNNRSVQFKEEYDLN